ncbi:glycosyl hydrolase [Streptomyces kronopolitis]|uniref:glycosyl hydrolase n=1 Tax=Streptomyces kronopolitis TaxID=1612435 RepID=UPI003D987D2A
MSDVLDFHLDDLVAANADSEYVEQRFWSGDLMVLAEHHTTADDSHSYVVAHDGSITWGIPGKPQVAAFKVSRDPILNTFTVEASYHATVPFAQNWLIEHGCPPERIARVGDGFMTPADNLTVQVEQQIRESGSRYEVLDSQTWDIDLCETWTLTHDSHADQVPVRVFLEEGNRDARTYTMREGAFADEVTARHWLGDRSSQLPCPPEFRGEATALRTRAAFARSGGASAMPKAGVDAHRTPPAGTTHRPNPERSM